MLTVDFDRLGVRDGARLLDMGCGGGRHAFEAWRRGATVVALDYSEAELKEVRAIQGAMVEAGEAPHGQVGGAVNGDALVLPFADATFDCIIASEVLEHLWADTVAIAELVRVLRPGGRIAVTVPTRWPERVCWALDHRYHDTPGGHVRIYRQPELEAKLEAAGLWLRGSHHAHALHSPYWWLKCATGVNRVDPPWAVRRYHDFLAWQITNRPGWVESLDRLLNPVLGKSLIVYGQKLTSESQSGAGYPGTERVRQRSE
ncbi:MAG: class I SAM-dependent methyltransferase [Acidimicrobiia bacterium]